MKIIDFDTIILIQSSSLYKEFNNVINAMTHRLSNISITHNEKESFRTYKEIVFAKSSTKTSFYTFEAQLYREKESYEYVISSQYIKNNDEYISDEVKEKVIEIMNSNIYKIRDNYSYERYFHDTFSYENNSKKIFGEDFFIEEVEKDNICYTYDGSIEDDIVTGYTSSTDMDNTSLLPKEDLKIIKIGKKKS